MTGHLKNRSARSKINQTRLEKCRIFFNQLKNYLISIAKVFKGVYYCDPKRLIKIIANTIIGTSLQGFCLGATLIILRRMDNQLLFELPKIYPLPVGKAHATILLSGVLLLLGIAVFLLYLAEKDANKLSGAFAKKCNQKLILNFPTIKNRWIDASIHAGIGLPNKLSGELATQSLKLELASNRILKSPPNVLQLLLGAGYLLYLEPTLTIILAVLAFPLTIPLRRFTLKVREAERLKREAKKTKNNDFAALVDINNQLLVPSEGSKNHFLKSFNISSFSLVSNHRIARRIAVAASRAVATTALIITGIASMLYFWLLYTGSESLIALIVVYFGSMRMAVMSGRQLASRMSSFARFYEEVLGYISDESILSSLKKGVSAPRVRGVYGYDIANEGGKDVIVKGFGPFAVAGQFSLMAINRYAMALPLKNMTRDKSAALMSEMVIASQDVDLEIDITWRHFLGIDSETESIADSLEKFCCVLDPAKIQQDLDITLRETKQSMIWLEKETIEAMLLRAYFREAPLIVIPEKAFAELDVRTTARWKKALSNRLVFVYYQYKQQTLGRWGEEYIALVGCDAKRPSGIVPVEWANNHSDMVLKFFQDRNGKGPADDGTELQWDDDDDEE